MSFMDEEDDESQEWLPREHQEALQAAIRSGGMPSASLALYARWWQLETWLRELIYVELRAKYGTGWNQVVSLAAGRQSKDATFTHMTGPDNENPLAYLDYSQLLKIIDDHWDLFSYALVTRRSWDGRQDDLTQIRHRIGHLRKPHPDDLARIEQTLRDLERGSFIAFASYNRKDQPDPQKRSDPITNGWIKAQHPTARRLIDHAASQYETTLNVQVSRRPWAAWPNDLVGAPGILWHADFYMAGRTVTAAALWRDTGLRKLKPLVIHAIVDSPWHVGFTFSAVDNPEEIADAIGDAFDTILTISHREDIPALADWDARTRSAREVDFRIVAGSGWDIIDDTTIPVSSFGAGGGVDALPSW